MNDLISRRAAIDAVKNEMLSWLEGDKTDYRNVVDAIMDVPSAEPKWIPVTERLPEEEEDVLVTRTFLGVKDIPPSTYVEVAQMHEDGSWYADSDEYKLNPSRHTNPIAWMPLPEPYRGENE